MRQIKYNFATENVRFEYPDEWDPEVITDVELTINDRSAEELLAAVSATIWTQTTLDEAATAYANTVTLDSGADDLAAGDVILIKGVNGDERHIVKAYDATNQIVTLVHHLQNAHDAADEVWGAFCNYTLDTTDTAVFLAGLVMTFVWTPDAGGIATNESAQIAKAALDLGGLRHDFLVLYPRAYKTFVDPDDIFDTMSAQAEIEIANELRSKNLDIQRIVDKSQIAPVIMAKMAAMWARKGDENKIDEREVLMGNYDNQIGFLLASPIWVDIDQDTVEDDGEVTDHQPFFERAWG